MQLYQKEESFSQFFLIFFKSTLNFKHFEKKDDPQRFYVFEIMDSVTVVR